MSVPTPELRSSLVACSPFFNGRIVLAVAALFLQPYRDGRVR